MDNLDLAAMLAKTLEDFRLSRGERQALRAVVDAAAQNETERARIQQLAFSTAKNVVSSPKDGHVLDWLQEVLRLLHANAHANKTDGSTVFFSPKDDCARQLASLIGRARQTLDVCVFTITDDRITAALLAAHQRRVQIRIITDDDKSADLGSDIGHLRDAGIPLRMDRTPAHMHHKFAIFDKDLLLNGSYNWTRGASALNRENLMLVDDQKLVNRFQQEFDRLWEQFGTGK